MIARPKTDSIAKSDYMRVAKVELAKFERNELAFRKKDRLVRAKEKNLPVNIPNSKKS